MRTTIALLLALTACVAEVPDTDTDTDTDTGPPDTDTDAALPLVTPELAWLDGDGSRVHVAGIPAVVCWTNSCEQEVQHLYVADADGIVWKVNALTGLGLPDSSTVLYYEEPDCTGQGWFTVNSPPGMAVETRFADTVYVVDRGAELLPPDGSLSLRSALSAGGCSAFPDTRSNSPEPGYPYAWVREEDVTDTGIPWDWQAEPSPLAGVDIGLVPPLHLGLVD